MNFDVLPVCLFVFDASSIRLVERKTVRLNNFSTELNITKRDLKYFLVDVSIIEPREHKIIVSVGTLNCLILPGKLYLILPGEGNVHDDIPTLFLDVYKYISRTSRDSVVDQHPELKCIECLFICAITGIKNQLDALEKEFSVDSSSISSTSQKTVAQGARLLGQVRQHTRNICAMLFRAIAEKRRRKRTTEAGITKQSEKQLRLARVQQEIATIIANASRVVDALEALLDDERDIVYTCFANQVLLYSDHKDGVFTTIEHDKGAKVFALVDNSSEGSDSSVDDTSLPVSLITLTDFFESYLYQIQSTVSRAKSLQAVIEHDFALLQLSMDETRNLLLLFQTCFEIVSASLALQGLISTFFGANILNPWFISPPGPLMTNPTSLVYLMSAVAFIIGVGFVFIAGSTTYFFMRIERNNR